MLRRRVSLFDSSLKRPNIFRMPRTRTKSGNLKGGQPAFFVKNGAKMAATPLLPGEKKKKKKWWKLFSK